MPYTSKNKPTSSQPLLKSTHLQDISVDWSKDAPKTLNSMIYGPSIIEKITKQAKSLNYNDESKLLFDNFFKPFSSLELKHPKLAAKLYVIIASAILLIIVHNNNTLLHDLPRRETLLIGSLFTCLINYSLVKNTMYRLAITNRHSSSACKHVLALMFGFVVLLFYGMKMLQLPLVLLIFYSVFFVVILMEATFLEKQFKACEIFLGLGAYIGVSFIILRSSDISWDVYKKMNTFSLMCGITVVGLSVCCMAGILMKAVKVKEESFAAINHGITMLIVILMPIVFLFKGMTIPASTQWLGLALLGFLACFGVILVVRSIQLESLGKISIYLLVHVIIGFLLKGRFEDNLAVFGCVLVLICLGLHFVYTSRCEKARSGEELPILGTTALLEMTEMRITIREDN